MTEEDLIKDINEEITFSLENFPENTNVSFNPNNKNSLGKIGNTKNFVNAIKTIETAANRSARRHSISFRL